MDGIGEVVAQIGRRGTAEAGEVLMREHDEADRVISLVAGRVRVTVATRRGPVAVLGFRGPGDVVGETGVLTGAPRSATVTAVEPVEYVAVAGTTFRRHLLEHPEAALAIAAQLARRLQESDRGNAEHLTSDTTARVAGRLLTLGEQYGIDSPEGRRIALPLTQDELAGLTGSSLEAVAKALRTLRSAGWIETGRRTITLTDTDALHRRAAG